MPMVRQVLMSDCDIAELPSWLDELSPLISLDLRKILLTTRPALRRLRQPTALEISYNQFTTLPESFALQDTLKVVQPPPSQAGSQR